MFSLFKLPLIKLFHLPSVIHHHLYKKNLQASVVSLTSIHLSPYHGQLLQDFFLHLPNIMFHIHHCDDSANINLQINTRSPTKAWWSRELNSLLGLIVSTPIMHRWSHSVLPQWRNLPRPELLSCHPDHRTRLLAFHAWFTWIHFGRRWHSPWLLWCLQLYCHPSSTHCQYHYKCFPLSSPYNGSKPIICSHLMLNNEINYSLHLFYLCYFSHNSSLLTISHLLLRLLFDFVMLMFW